MRCPACHAENAAGADRCVACGAPLAAPPSPEKEGRPGRRGSGSRRRVSSEDDPSAAEPWEATTPAARRAYRLALLSLVPGLGLVLGPLAVLLGCLAGRASDKDARSRTQARLAVLLGALVALTQWTGVLLMIHGWRS
jgi:hypothetical protein